MLTFTIWKISIPLCFEFHIFSINARACQVVPSPLMDTWKKISARKFILHALRSGFHCDNRLRIFLVRAKQIWRFPLMKSWFKRENHFGQLLKSAEWTFYPCIIVHVFKFSKNIKGQCLIAWPITHGLYIFLSICLSIALFSSPIFWG